MKTLYGISLCLLGSFLIGLTVNSLGDMGNTLRKVIGIICIALDIKTVSIKNKKKLKRRVK
ncbi:hypothetical protein [Ectobacillus funiculus]|uniref:hypothetical protein n=1 Tax=Ectobacillus funiculus TaxID=137993 RepID=UPI00101C821A|nr:hypothetical protein [Ectobacillus funiculus]